MKFQALISEFQKALTKTLPAMPRKSTLPVLEHFLISLTGNELQIVATDQDLIISTTLQVEGEEDGSILIPGRRITDIFRALGDSGTFKFVSDPENFEVTVHTLLGNYKMKGIDSDEYLDLPVLFKSEKPPIQPFVDKDSVEDITDSRIFFNDGTLQKLSTKTYFAVSTDEYRPAMTGVLFQFRGDYVNAVATDSFRLVKSVHKSDEVKYPNELDVIIPSRTLEIIKKIEDDIVMTFIKTNKKISHARFDTLDTVYISRVIDEQFPAYESVIPLSCRYNAKMSKASTLAAIRRVAIFSSEHTHQIRFSFMTDKLHIHGRDEDRGTSAQEEINCEFAEDPIEVGFNFKYLDEMISNIECSADPCSLVMSFNEPNRAVLIKPEFGEEELTMLIMPIRI